MRLILSLLAAAITLLPSRAPAEVRGTWLTTTANTAIASPDRTAETMRRLRDIGLNTVYVECWKNGYTEFPSEVLRKAVGVDMRVNPSEKGKPAVQRDLLAECVAEAHKNNLACIAWFEYGFMAAYKETHTEIRARRDWLSLNRQGGDVAKNGFVWLNPLHPDAQNLLIGIVVEAVKKYDLDGVQLDDRIVWPSLEMGYDDFTKNAYAKDHDGHEPPTDIKDPEWCRWRESKVTDFSKRFVKEVRAAARASNKPNLIISLSPGPHPWALENYLCDWPSWSRWDNALAATPRVARASWDEYVPQCYRLNYDAFAKSWQDQLDAIGDRRKDLVAGIRVVGDGPDLTWDDLKKSIELTRQSHAGGHSLWFSRGVLDLYPNELKSFYNGWVPNPARP